MTEVNTNQLTNEITIHRMGMIGTNSIALPHHDKAGPIWYLIPMQFVKESSKIAFLRNKIALRSLCSGDSLGALPGLIRSSPVDRDVVLIIGTNIDLSS